MKQSDGQKDVCTRKAYDICDLCCMSEYADVPVDTCLCVRVDTEEWLKRDTQTHRTQDETGVPLSSKTQLKMANVFQLWPAIE